MKILSDPVFGEGPLSDRAPSGKARYTVVRYNEVWLYCPIRLRAL
jgi:hypothetical protein